jgi:predicted acyl esterase
VAFDDVVPDDPEGDLYDPFEARVHAQHSGGEWYAAEEWPPAAASPTRFYLGTEDDLRRDASDETGRTVVYVDETREFDPAQPSDPEQAVGRARPSTRTRSTRTSGSPARPR